MVPELDANRVRKWAHDKTPAEFRDEMRVEVDETPRGLTILDCRPPWSELIGSEWTRSPIARRQDEGMTTTCDEGKFTELLVYVASRLQGDQSGGATKLNKILFFADFAHVRRTGAPITGAEYQKLEHGPATRRLHPVRDRLIENGDAELVDEEFLGNRQHRLVPHRAADLTVFSDDELATIDKVLTDLDGLNARQVSDRSHDEAGWRLVEFGDTIPYEAALVGARQVSTPTVRDLHLQGRVMAGRADRRGRL